MEIREFSPHIKYTDFSVITHNILTNVSKIMKNTIIVLTATVAMSLCSVALAEEAQGPVLLTDAQMESVVAGTASRHHTDYLGWIPSKGFVLRPVGNVESARPTGRINNFHAKQRNAFFFRLEP